MSAETDRYIESLRTELRKRGVLETRFVEETRGHLAEAARRRGLDAEAAEREALARYGDARTVAAKFAAEKNRMLHWVLLATAVTLGLAIAWVDSRPHWDDAGITAGMLFLSAGLLGLTGPRRPWLWALGIGLWIPLWMVVHATTVGSALGSFVLLAFPMAGAYAGMVVRMAARASLKRA
ncbi:MAG TPA: hypothetical protein VHX37_05420 [Acidobacteriaceae bacterium]|jgi:hypothetical protein|nr:hypothetical protein [Acidobacteriaceae bacterium]